MIVELILSAAMVVVTVTMHGGGLYALSRMLRIEEREEMMEGIHPTSPRHIVFLLALVFGIFAIHGIEIWSYALLYVSLEAIPDLRTAVYFSTITYAAIGYDDEAMAESWRLVSAIEGVNGVILLGWSTAFFVTVVARLGRQ
jgi:hypothetical protein